MGLIWLDNHEANITFTLYDICVPFPDENKTWINCWYQAGANVHDCGMQSSPLQEQFCLLSTIDVTTP